MSNLSPSMLRQQWLEQALAAMRGLFHQAGYTIPDAVRVSCGFPKGSGGRSKIIGQCWAETASGDKHNEIFISPELGGKDAGPRIMGVIAHECTHAVVGVDKGHKRPFKDCALAVGLEGKMTATTESEGFNKWAAIVIERIGPYPAAPLSTFKLKKKATYLLKCECAECGYVARVTAKWVDAGGAPICPTDQISMKCNAIEGDDDDE